MTRKENAHALYRVSWIFSQPNLMSLVVSQSAPASDSYSASFSVDKSLNSSLSKMEENSALAKELCRNIAQARNNILKALEVSHLSLRLTSKFFLIAFNLWASLQHKITRIEVPLTTQTCSKVVFFKYFLRKIRDLSR